MRKLVYSVAVAATLFGAVAEASANDAADRTAAIHMCRAETIARANAPADKVRLDSVSVRPRAVRVDLDLWTAGGQLVNVRCDVTRGAQPTIVALNPPLADTQASAQ
jgi:hypothetical protein